MIMEIFVNIIQLSFKTTTVMFSLDITAFVQHLIRMDYKAVQKGQTANTGIPIRDGDILLKNDVVINVDQNSQIITISGISTENILQIFEEVSPVITMYGLDMEREIHGYSIVADYVIDTDKNPQITIGNFLASDNNGAGARARDGRLAGRRPRSLARLRLAQCIAQRSPALAAVRHLARTLLRRRFAGHQQRDVRPRLDIGLGAGAVGARCL